MKSVESGDPLELVGVGYPMEINVEMDKETARCLIEEYALTGFAASEVLALFGSPAYSMPYAIYQRRGAGFVKDLVHGVFGEAK